MIVPKSAISATFEATEFVGKDGLALDSASRGSLLNFFGDSVDIDILMRLVICSVKDETGVTYRFGPTDTITFKVGIPIKVVSYQCAITLGA